MKSGGADPSDLSIYLIPSGVQDLPELHDGVVEGGAVILEIQTAHLASLYALQGLEAYELGQVRLQSQHHTALRGVEGEVFTERADAVAEKMFVEEKRDVLEYNMLKKMKLTQRPNV